MSLHDRIPSVAGPIEARRTLPTLVDALRHIAHMAGPSRTEHVPLALAGGRILASSVVALIGSPRRDSAGMDGFALGAESPGEDPPRWRVVDASTIGDDGLARGTAVRVITGAPLPDGACGVLPIEHARLFDGTVSRDGTAPQRSHVREQGSDFRHGDVTLTAGCRIGPRALVAAAAADVTTVEVHRLPRVGMIVRGNALVAPGQAAAIPDAVPDILTDALLLFAAEWGGRPFGGLRVGSDPAALAEAIATLRGEADVIVLVGGAAHGARDATKAALDGMGFDLSFDGLAIRPGRPTFCGRIGATQVLALPGNPTAALTVARLLLAPLLARLGGAGADTALVWEDLALVAPVAAVGERDAFLCGAAEAGGVRILDRRDALGQMLLASADRLVLRPANGAALSEGAIVPTLRF